MKRVALSTFEWLRLAKGLCLSLKADQKLRSQAHIRLLLMGDVAGTAESGFGTLEHRAFSRMWRKKWRRTTGLCTKLRGKLQLRRAHSLHGVGLGRAVSHCKGQGIPRQTIP